MNSLKSFLATHPFIGLGSSIGGGIMPFIVSLTPILQVAGIILGLAIGYLTLEAKLAERRERKANGSGKKNS